MEEIRNNFECSICLSEFPGKQGLLKCGHAFCYECISEWMETNNTCPICRKEGPKKIVQLSSVPDVLKCLNGLNFKYVFAEHINTKIENKKCYSCKNYYGTLCKCIDTHTLKFENICLCSHCAKMLIYKDGDIIGDYGLFEPALKSKYESNYDIIPSNYNLLDYFYKKKPSEMIEAITRLTDGLDISKHYINTDTANRFYNIVKSCLPNGHDHNVFEHLAHKIGPYVTEWHRSDLLCICLKGLYDEVFGQNYDVDRKINLKLYIKFMYGLRTGAFENLQWHYYDTNNLWINGRVLNFVK